MVRELGEVRVDRAAKELLERLADGLMGHHPLRGGHACEQGLPDQAVAEAEVAGGRPHRDDEPERGRGVGERLMREALAIAEASGARTVDLTSRPSREAANRLYERLGFEARETGVYRLSPPREPRP